MAEAESAKLGGFFGGNASAKLFPDAAENAVLARGHKPHSAAI